MPWPTAPEAGRCSIEFGEELYKEIRELAEARGLSMTAYVRGTMQDFVTAARVGGTSMAALIERAAMGQVLFESVCEGIARGFQAGEAERVARLGMLSDEGWARAEESLGRVIEGAGKVGGG